MPRCTQATKSPLIPPFSKGAHGQNAGRQLFAKARRFTTSGKGIAPPFRKRTRYYVSDAQEVILVRAEHQGQEKVSYLWSWLRINTCIHIKAVSMPTSIRLAPETERRLNLLAERTGRTKGYYLREIIEQGVSKKHRTTASLRMYLNVCALGRNPCIQPLT
ncbi:hypothetical protein [Halothiobacillus sp.]|uniref:hypothetical protein n=1 Tax=Halothiobacillus sp. TaxID=1891311 RepID=UPI0026123021|nr:hypothetical protein [Halothiobacillus sp.]MDD4965938.1 hypothetical protein [Halothiobacillus sp.]